MGNMMYGIFNPASSSMRQNPFGGAFRLLFVVLVLCLSSCSFWHGRADPGPLYDEAARFMRLKRFPEALDAWNRALAADTLKGFPPRAIDALVQKSHIEYIIGEYDAAFRSFSAIDRHAAGAAIPDSLRSGLLLSRARMHAELGDYGQAATVIGRIATADPWIRLQQASWQVKAGDIPAAAATCNDLAASDEPSVRISALAGLLDCSVARKEPGLLAPEVYAAKIAAVSARVMSGPAPAEQRIRALRTAARSLLQLESQRRNASFLLFRALALAQQERYVRLDQILQCESNAVVVNKPDVYRSTIEFFGQRNMPYSRLAAMYRLGMCPEVPDAERIGILKNALQNSQYYGIPPTATGFIRLEKSAVAELEDLLIAGGRYFDLFEAGEDARLLDLQREAHSSITSLRLPAGHEALRAEIIRLTRDISGLQQRKINMMDDASGFELAVIADKAISRKRGRLIDLTAEVATFDREAASTLGLTPVTLLTVQKCLKPGEALVRIFVRDSLATGMLISSREMQIISSSVPGDQVRGDLDVLRRRLAAGGPELAATLRNDPQRLRLSSDLFQTIGERLSGYSHLVFISDLPMPFQVLGSSGLLGAERKVSVIGSAREAVMYAVPVAATGAAGRPAATVFIDAAQPSLARIHKLYHPDDKVFLLWKPLPAGEADGLKRLLAGVLQRNGGSGSGALFSLASGSGGTGMDGRWVWLTPYGTD